MRRRSSFAGVALAVVGALCVAAAGVAAGALWTADATPRSLASPTPLGSAPVTEREFADERPAQLEFRLGAEQTLTSPAGGRVTAFTCAAGTPFASGSSVLELDGVRIVNIATRVPLWRDLQITDSGPDVAALQAELARLGYPVAADGVVGARTLAAAHRLLDPGSRAHDREPLPLARFLWLPHTRTAIGACTTATGARLAPDGEVAAVVTGPVSATVGAPPAGAVPGPRVALLNDHRLPIGAGGRIEDPAALAVVAAAPQYAEARRDSGTTIPVDLALARPLRVSAVPPGALYDVVGSAGCVTTNGTPRPVAIVGSELGATFVTFTAGDPPDAVDVDPRSTPPCR